MDKLKTVKQVHAAVQQAVQGDCVAVTVQGDCMAPLIKNDALVRISPARWYWPGDVVVVLAGNGRYLVHRVIGVYRKSAQIKVVTQADSAPCPDTAVYMDEVLGRVSGGCCHPHVIHVPLSHRLRAVWRFIRFGLIFFYRKHF